MDYNAETETFHLSYSLYTDDFELALRKQTGLKIEIERFSESNEKLIFDFIINQSRPKRFKKKIKIENEF